MLNFKVGERVDPLQVNLFRVAFVGYVRRIKVLRVGACDCGGEHRVANGKGPSVRITGGQVRVSQVQQGDIVIRSS